MGYVFNQSSMVCRSIWMAIGPENLCSRNYSWKNHSPENRKGKSATWKGLKAADRNQAVGNKALSDQGMLLIGTPLVWKIFPSVARFLSLYDWFCVCYCVLCFYTGAAPSGRYWLQSCYCFPFLFATNNGERQSFRFTTNFSFAPHLFIPRVAKKVLEVFWWR